MAAALPRATAAALPIRLRQLAVRCVDAEPVNVLLVIDKSGSMTDMPDDFDSDKWTAMKTSVAAALAPVKDQLRLGLELYPLAGCDMPDGSDVEVDVQAGGKALSMITKDAWRRRCRSAARRPRPRWHARARLLHQGRGQQLDGDKYVLLATDGGPNCNDALTAKPMPAP